ncbi:MAG: hypothetical protein ACLQPD_19290 [Desulfomonilaceae bacterium]
MKDPVHRLYLLIGESGSMNHSIRLAHGRWEKNHDLAGILRSCADHNTDATTHSYIF